MSWQWLANIIGIGSATGIDDSGTVQQMQVTEGAAGSGFAARVTDKVKRVMEFGFSSVPPINSEVVMIRLGGDRSCSIIIGTNHQPSRPTGLQPGNSMLYDVRGALIKLTAAGMVIDAAGLPMTIQNSSRITLDAPDVEMTGTLTVAGDITGLNGSSALALSAIRTKFNEHDHAGVATGSGSTGNPNETL